MKNVLLFSFIILSLGFSSRVYSTEIEEIQQNIEENREPEEGSDLVELIQKICFNKKQIENGIKEQTFSLNKNETINIIVMNNPNKDDNFDCSANNFSYPFINNILSKDPTKGFWFGSSVSSKIIEKLTPVEAKNAKSGDIIVFRQNNQITQVGLINVVLKKGDEYPDQYIIDFNYKPEVTPPVRYSLEIPSEIDYDSEIYSLDNNPLEIMLKN